MLLYIRFPADAHIDPAEVEEAALGAIGRSGAVIGASPESVDLELDDAEDVGQVVSQLAASLRRAGLPPATVIDIPRSGQRFSIFDF